GRATGAVLTQGRAGRDARVRPVRARRRRPPGGARDRRGARDDLCAAARVGGRARGGRLARRDARRSAMRDSIELEVVWASLINTVNEQAKALQRSAFSPIVREAGDLANALFDRRARMVAQAVTGTPGHINALAVAAGEMLADY